MRKWPKIVLPLFLLTFLFFIPVNSGFKLVDGKGELLRYIPAESKELTVGWRHSVEKTPWRETYLVDETGMMSLISTVYMSYGAGTPDRDGDAQLMPDGTIHVTGIERIIPYYSLFYIPLSQYYIEVDGKEISLSEFVPEYEEVRIYYDNIQLYEWILIETTYFN